MPRTYIVYFHQHCELCRFFLQAAADAARKGLDVAYRLAPPLVARCLLGDSIRIRQVCRGRAARAAGHSLQGAGASSERRHAPTAAPC